MHIKVGDRVRYEASIVRNRMKEYRVVELANNDMILVKPIDRAIDDPKRLRLARKAVRLPFNTYEYGGPLGSGIRITHPGKERIYGHPTFILFRKEWESLMHQYGYVIHADRTGRCIWWASLYADFVSQPSHATCPSWITDFLERWSVRPVPRRLIDGDGLVWFPGMDSNSCYEKKLLEYQTCPTCLKEARSWDQDEAWLQYCSEECYNGLGKESDMSNITKENQFLDLENLKEQLDFLMADNDRLEQDNESGHLELQQVRAELQKAKNEVIARGKEKSAMHRRAQKAESELASLEKKHLALHERHSKASDLISRTQSERDQNRNLCVELQKEIGKLKIELVTANTPRAVMADSEKLDQHVQKVLACRTSQVVGLTLQRNAAKSRVAELEMVVESMQEEMDQNKVDPLVLITQAKCAAIRTGIRAGATFGSLYFLLQYLTG